MAHQQRFCPLCNRAFNEGEAVLRCEGCEVLHHPGCWVKNGGCATPSEHRVAPIALAYQQNAAPIAPTSSGAPDLSDATDADDPAPALAAGVAVIGAGATGRPPPAGGDVLASGRVIHRGEPLPTHVDPPTPPRRYVPAPPGPASGARPMPRIYRRNRLLGYWYFPAAALLAVGIAFGVIWLFDRISESDEPGDAVVTTPGVEGSPRAQTSPTAAATRAAGATTPAAGSTPADKFRAGDA
ncbi:MAG: RING finger protein, partial [Tepidiformaceae bacterium]